MGRKETAQPNVREIVLEILCRESQGRTYGSGLIQEALRRYDGLDGRQKAFIKRTAEGTIERRITIDYVLNRYSKVPVAKMKPYIRELLRMSCCQILFMEHIPDAAACDEAVRLAGRSPYRGLRGYVNGVLRSIVREKENIVWPDQTADRLRYLSVRYSMPVPLAAHLREAYGDARCETVLRALLESRPVSVRVRGDAEEAGRLAALWREAGAVVTAHPYLPYALSVSGSEGVEHLAGYREGAFAVQDVSSMLVVENAGIRPGDTVLDVCASPGGKTFHAADVLAGTGQVIACDVSSRKTDKIEENKRRLRARNVSVSVRDARVYDSALAECADVLLADVPCSGLGVIGRKPDIKYRITPESMREITALQRDILRNAVRYLKPDGIMMYSTCTMNPAENEQTADWLCETFGMEKVSMADTMPKPLQQEAAAGTLQLLPGIHETDGFFLAKLYKKQP